MSQGFDDTMTDSQASQFVRDMLPPGQGDLQQEKENQRLINGRTPVNVKEMLVVLATLNKENAIGKVINAVKTSDKYVQNNKNLSAVSKDLKTTQSYLTGLKEKDTKLEALKVEGLKIMVMHQLKMIMPQKCKDSNDIFYPLSGERIEI